MKENNFWNSKQGESLIKLIIWLVFIVILYLVLTFGFGGKTSNNNTKNKTNEVENKEEVTDNVVEGTFFDIRNKNYEYTYNVMIGEEKYVYNGTISLDSDSGYKESNEGIIKYEKIGDKYYQVTLNEQIEIPNLYENLQVDFLNYDILYTIISEYNCQNTYCEFDYNGYNGSITKINDTSFNVNFNKEQENYDLIYKNIK